jgi:hypothetical protein
MKQDIFYTTYVQKVELFLAHPQLPALGQPGRQASWPAKLKLRMIELSPCGGQGLEERTLKTNTEAVGVA